jgi:hypothetical protein
MAEPSTGPAQDTPQGEIPGGHGTKLPRKQGLLIANLLTASTYREAAEATGISMETLQKWLRLPQVQAEYKAAARAVLDLTVDRLAGLATRAVDALARNLDCGNPATEVRAGVALLGQLAALRGVLETEERLAALQAQLAELQEKLVRPHTFVNGRRHS